MWPLFTDSWGSWRCDDLNLGPCPFTVGVFYTGFIYIFDTLYSYNSVIRKKKNYYLKGLFMKQNIAVLKNEKEKKKEKVKKHRKLNCSVEMFLYTCTLWRYMASLVFCLNSSKCFFLELRIQ
jgi:hypothetical protein